MTTPQAQPAPPIRVLLADDMGLFRRAIATLLDGQPDLEVVGQAENGLEATELAASLRPDVLLLDLEMPVMTGLEAAERVLELSPGTKVVMLTVNDSADDLLAAVRLGVHGYLLKDLAPDDLFAMVRSAARGENPVAHQLVGRLLDEVRRGPASPQVVSPEVAPSATAVLSHRELDIVRLVAQGCSNREIARALTITEGTVKNHVHNALHKLGLETRVQLAAHMVRAGLAGPSTPERR